MRHRGQRRTATNLLALTASLALCTACGSQPDETGVIKGRWAPEEWTGEKAGADLPRWEHVDAVEIDRDATPDLDREVGAESVADEIERERDLVGPRGEDSGVFPEGEGEIVFAAVDVRRGERYRVHVRVEDLELLHREMIRSGGIHASRQEGDPEPEERRLEGDAKPEPGYTAARWRPRAPSGVVHALAGGHRATSSLAVPATWSNNTDTRTRRAIADGVAANHSTYRRIGQLNDACSGTLIGPRHVLTAAHCLVDNSDQRVFWSVFRPRRNGEDSTPWGARDPEWYWFPEEYWDGTCSGSGACNRYDIALIILAPWAGAHPGWFGYWYVGAGTMQNWNIYMRGYPRADSDSGACFDYPSRPASCTPWVLYGDAELCDTGSFFSPDSSDWNREVSLDCDGSRGMSGSAFYTYNAHPSGPVALGEYSQYWCTPPTGCAGMTFANVMTRITPQYASIISWWRNFCPTTQSQCF